MTLQELASVYPFSPCTTDVQEGEMQTDKYVKSRVKLMIISHSPACVTFPHARLLHLHRAPLVLNIT